MAVGRYARHTLPGLRQELREEELYAEDMYGTSPWAGADPTKGLTGDSPRWQFDPDTNQGVCGDWKIPEDRVPGTPISVYFIFSLPGNGGQEIVWVLTHLVVQIGAAATPDPTVRTTEANTVGLNILQKAPTIYLATSLFDNKQAPVDLQLTFNRFAAAGDDTDTNVADLYKVIFEYMAYV